MAHILGEFGIEGYRANEAGGNAGSRAAALQGFAGFRGAVRDCAKAGMAAGSADPKGALKDILAAADRCHDFASALPELALKVHMAESFTAHTAKD